MNSSVQNRIFFFLCRAVFTPGKIYLKKNSELSLKLKQTMSMSIIFSCKTQTLDVMCVCRVKRVDAQCRRQSVTAANRLALIKEIHEVFIFAFQYDGHIGCR